MPIKAYIALIIFLTLLLCASIGVIIYLGVLSTSAGTDVRTPPPPRPSSNSSDYFGLSLGPLSRLAHGVSGWVYIVDEKRIFIKDLTYDGTAPLGYFWIGLKNKSSDYPDASGQPTPDENGSLDNLRRSYKREDVWLTLQPNITVRDLKWFGLWCVQFKMNFGHVLLAERLDVPGRLKLGEFYVQGMTVRSGPVTALDHKTVLIERFTCESRLNDIYFIAGNGSSPSVSNSIVKIPRDGEGLKPLDYRNLTDVTVTLVFPPELSLFNVDFIAIYSSSLPFSYGMIVLPRFINVPPHRVEPKDEKRDVQP